ncbi:hypothetical protein [Bdellovibrio sp. KM01]|uniref:hypothetical protein n=1 Tax=Bdellovibrio sp. KM01 TaxID=2748865 RepID=UPI0015EACA38|nr:hypothetical protein [Bdellovibrio sp. KM01]QLY25713.1 hypothetical protein HW988_01285 [Bdellovibrio sp. KM01]
MKKIVFALITLMVMTVSAAPLKMKAAPYKKGPDFYRGVVYFHYDIKGKKEKESLHIQQDIIRVNAEPVQKKNWKKGEPAMKVLLKLEKSSSAKCTAGSYSLRVAKGEQKSQVEKGCVGTPRFKQLQQAFAILKDLVPKQYDKNLNPL